MREWPSLDSWSLPEQANHAPAELRERLRTVLAARTRFEADPGSGRASAVLVPLFESADATHLWLCRRSEALRRHTGQVAFPGGTRDEGDVSLLHTALREASEEVGLVATQCDVLGPLDDLVTGTGYVITPYVAWIASEFSPTPNEAEVARVFSMPLSAFAATPAGEFPRIGWTYDGELVWGATCAMIIDLFTAMRGA